MKRSLALLSAAPILLFTACGKGSSSTPAATSTLTAAPTDTGSGTGTVTGTRTNTGSGTVTGTRTSTGSGTSTRNRTGSTTSGRTSTGSGTGTGVAAPTNTGSGTGSGGGVGTDTGTSACPRLGSTAPGGGGTSYHVGSGQAYATIGAVPWYSLKAGDTVYIHYQSTPYHEKFLVSGQGTASQWIRVLGVAGPNCELPVISGDAATTSKNMHHYWQDATGGSAIQDSGIIQIAVNSGTVLPAYIQISGLEVKDSGTAYKFTAENGTTANYGSFSACIYARSVSHMLVSGNTLHNCGLGFYNWIGDGSAPGTYWAGLEVDTVLQGNYFYDNGTVGDYTCHQSYTESQGVVIEYNHYGQMKTGALGSQLKDRSAGTIVRYNYIEQSPQGWDLDLVNPQNSWPALGSLPTYGRDFVYGNIIVDENLGKDIIHWDEDDQSGQGRANQASGMLAFYDNTVVVVANQSDSYGSLDIFNETWGGYDCPTGALPGVIDQRNNIYASLPRTAGSATLPLQFGYCGLENLNFGTNWVSPGWTLWKQGKATANGTSSLVSPAANDAGFVNAAGNDFHLAAGSSALGIGGALAPAVTSNPESLDLTPVLQYVADQKVQIRTASGAGSDLGALGK